MEILNTSRCQTCLGSFERTIDLFDLKYKVHLETLQRLLGLQLFVEGRKFFICSQCQDKLIWVSEFQNLCLKSLEQLGNVDYKTEIDDDVPLSQLQTVQEVKGETSPCASVADDNDNAYSDEDNYVPEKRVRSRKPIAKRACKFQTRSSKRILKNIRQNQDNTDGITNDSRANKRRTQDNDNESHADNSRPENKRQKRDNADATADDDSSRENNSRVSDNDSGINTKAKKAVCKVISKGIRDKSQPGETKPNGDKDTRSQQFPSDEVAEAVADCRRYLNDMKHKQCILCAYIGTNSPNLQLHVRKKHVKEFTTWCKHCNMITQNLEEHRDSVKCYEQKCKFCGEVFTKMKYIKLHLEQHCREFYPLTVDNRASKDEPIWKMYLQYPEADVFKAIADSTAYMTDLKNRSCLSCDFVGSTSSALSFHLRLKHKEIFKNWCCRCNLNTDDLHAHMNTTKCSEFRCVFCNRVFLKIDKLTMHLKLHAGIDAGFKRQNNKRKQIEINKDKRRKLQPRRKFRPSRCKKVSNIRSSRLQQFPANEVLEAIADSRSYITNIKNRQCVLCDYVAVDSGILQLHFVRKHKNEFTKWCKHCNMVTHNLQEHRDSVKCYEVECKLCGDIFTRIKYLKTHLQQHCRTTLFQPAVDKLDRRSSKDEPKWKPCEQYPETEVLQAIADSTAFMTDLKNRSCLYCDFISPTPKILSSHLKLTHKEAFKNWCYRCNLTTDDLQLHIKNTKCNENRCVFCKKVFSLVLSLTKHLKRHCRTLNANEDNEQDNIPEGDLTEKTKDKRGKSIKPVQCNRPGNRGCRLQQFPVDQVLEAMAECRSYLTNIKSRQCVLCDYVGTDATTLPLHIRGKHVDEFSTWCYRCNMVTQNLQEHRESVKCDEQKCKLCGVTYFSRIMRMERHLQQHCRELYPPKKNTSIDEPLWTFYEKYPEAEVLKAIADSTAYMTELDNRSCLYCNYVGSTSRTLSFHLRLKHKEAFKNWCGRCNLYTDDLHVHMKTTKCSEMRCVFCNAVFLKHDKLTMHLKLHCGRFELEKEEFSCKDCRGSFSKEDDWKNHECKKVDTVANKNRQSGMAQTDKKLDTNEPKNKENDDKKRICPICGQTFVSAYLDKHMFSHTGKMPYKCSFCGKGFTSLTFFKTHEMRHTGIKPFVCHVCGKTFVTSAEQKIHMPIHEGGPVTCAICNKEFSRPGVLKLHLRQHTGENKFCCVDCGKSFHIKSLLQNHMRTHRNERPFKCSFCVRDFSDSTTLRRHERVHKGIRPYKCTICSFSCVQASGLNTHMKQHPEDAPQADRPHKCFFCYRQFTTNAMLMSHTNNYHKGNT